jgi:hypothetical protein
VWQNAVHAERTSGTPARRRRGAGAADHAVTAPGEELKALLTSFGSPAAVCGRVAATEESGFELEQMLARCDGYVFAACAAGALRDASALGWFAFTAGRAVVEGWEGETPRAAAARHLAAWLKRRAERDGPASIAGRAAALAAHPQPRVRAAAATALRPHRDVPELAGLASALLHDPDPAVRYAARTYSDPPGTGLLPPGVSVEVDPALVATLDPQKFHFGRWYHPRPGFGPALSRLPDAPALRILPRLISASYLPHDREKQVLRALLKRPGGPDAFLAEVLPRLAAAGVQELAWAGPVAGPLSTVPSAEVMPALFDTVERHLPPPGLHQSGLHPGRLAAQLIGAFVPFDPAPLRQFLKRLGDGGPADLGVRWQIAAILRRVLAACKGRRRK